MGKLAGKFNHIPETKVEVMWYDEVQMVIKYRLLDISSEICVDNPIILIPKSLYPDRITYENFDKFLRSRLPDPTRADIDDILRAYGIREFQPVAMCKKSHGRNMTDFLWLRFNNEKLTYNDIRLR